MFARICKTVVTAIVAVIATASTGFGMIFLAALITVLSGNAPTKTAQETPVIEPQAPKSSPLPAISQPSVTTKKEIASIVRTGVDYKHDFQGSLSENGNVIEIQYLDSNSRSPITRIAKFDLDNKKQFIAEIQDGQNYNSEGKIDYTVTRNGENAILHIHSLENNGELVKKSAYVITYKSSRKAVESSDIPLVQESKTVRHLNTSEFFITTVQADNLNCRLTPVNGKSIKRLSREQSVQVVATDESKDNDTWYKIATGDCWVNGRYLSDRTTDSLSSNVKSGYTTEEAELEANIVQSTATNCSDLKAQGYNNIQVWANPDLAKLDRDNDGTTCESSKK